ncbi:MAG: hypothetical protein Kow0025_02880 [Thermodesulfovibrionales bacterium]
MQRRIIFLVIVSMLIILVSLGVISSVSVNDSIQRSLESRLTLAEIISKNVDYILENNLTRLHDISLSGAVDLSDGDWEPEKRALRAAYEYSIFTDSIFLIDERGNVVLTYPHRESADLNIMGLPAVAEALAGRRQVVSGVFTLEPTRRKVIFALVPLTDGKGEFAGLAGGEINPANYMFTRIIKSISSEAVTIELIDSHGIIISSNDPRRILSYTDHNKFLGNLISERKSTVGKCHRCHTDRESDQERTGDMLAFAPLSLAPWGVSVRVPQEVAFAPSINLRKVFSILSVIYLLTSLLLAVGLSRSIVKPIQTLIGATQRIGRGNLTKPVEVASGDEIGTLARSFDDMRLRLAESLDKIQRYNVELEKRVIMRTQEIQQGRKRLAKLLEEVIGAQEEERKRIARELHDETSQFIAAIGMSLEVAQAALREGKLSPKMLGDIALKVTHLLDDVHLLIQDLRPPVLDDLGLESAVRWLLERHVSVKGINYELVATPEFKAAYSQRGFLGEKAELTLFRVIQEAITNISRHAEAGNVLVRLGFTGGRVKVEIIDDGRGFDVAEAMSEAGGKGYGLLGIIERVDLLEGVVEVDSRPGRGTRLVVTIPTGAGGPRETAYDGQDQHIDSR